MSDRPATWTRFAGFSGCVGPRQQKRFLAHAHVHKTREPAIVMGRWRVLLYLIVYCPGPDVTRFG